MSVRCTNVVLVVEGAGDAAAVPRLIREVLRRHNIFELRISNRTKRNVDIKRLRRTGELERYVQYCLKEEGDSVLIVLDCEDFDPEEIGREFAERIARVGGHKKVGVVLFKSEFETLFLYSLPEIARHFPEYNWYPDRVALAGNLEGIRDAKGRISHAMKTRAYRATRDQEKFITAMNYERLQRECPSFSRLELTLLWLVGIGPHADEQFFPPLPR